MTKDEVWRRLCDSIVDVFEDEEAVLDARTTATDIDGWDSVSNIEFMVTLEQQFGIRFKTGEMASIENLGQLADRISALLEQKDQ